MEKATHSPLDHDLMVKAIRPPMECEPVHENSFDEMLADLVEQEEKRLQVNSEEFNRRHMELMKLIDNAYLKE